MILLFIIIWWFQPIDLSPGDLLYYGGVEWLNISDFLGEESILWLSPTVSNDHHPNPPNHKFHFVNRKDQEGFGTARNVLRLQDRGCLPLQGAPQTEEEVNHCEWRDHYHHDKIIDDPMMIMILRTWMSWWRDDLMMIMILRTWMSVKTCWQGSSSKSSAAEVEIIRYQVLVPVTEVQVGDSDHDDHGSGCWS